MLKKLYAAERAERLSLCAFPCAAVLHSSEKDQKGQSLGGSVVFTKPGHSEDTEEDGQMRRNKMEVKLTMTHDVAKRLTKKR